MYQYVVYTIRKENERHEYCIVAFKVILYLLLVYVCEKNISYSAY